MVQKYNKNFRLVKLKKQVVTIIIVILLIISERNSLNCKL